VAVGRQAELARLDLREQVQREAQLSRIQTAPLGAFHYRLVASRSPARPSRYPCCKTPPPQPSTLTTLPAHASHHGRPGWSCSGQRLIMSMLPARAHRRSRSKLAPQLQMRGLRRLALHATAAMASPSQPDAIRQRSHQHRQARQPAQHGGKRLRIPPLHTRAGSTCAGHQAPNSGLPGQPARLPAPTRAGAAPFQPRRCRNPRPHYAARSVVDISCWAHMHGPEALKGIYKHDRRAHLWR
jgi:hypothetical protein